jgi:hypothetical protein
VAIDVPDPLPVPMEFVPLAIPLPKFVAIPTLDATPLTIAGPLLLVLLTSNGIPKDPIAIVVILRVPMPEPEPPVEPIETGPLRGVGCGGEPTLVTMAFSTRLTTPAMVRIGTAWIGRVRLGTSGSGGGSVLGCMELYPPKKLPVPEEVVVPAAMRVPVPPGEMETVPVCKPVAPPVALPIAEPNMVVTMPVLPLVLANTPFPLDCVVAPNGVGRLESVIPTEAVAEPPPPAVPEISPKPCSFLDPLRLRRARVLLLGEA